MIGGQVEVEVGGMQVWKEAQAQPSSCGASAPYGSERVCSNSEGERFPPGPPLQKEVGGVNHYF